MPLLSEEAEERWSWHFLCVWWRVSTLPASQCGTITALLQTAQKITGSSLSTLLSLGVTFQIWPLTKYYEEKSN